MTKNTSLVIIGLVIVAVLVVGLTLGLKKSSVTTITPEEIVPVTEDELIQEGVVVTPDASLNETSQTITKTSSLDEFGSELDKLDLSGADVETEFGSIPEE